MHINNLKKKKKLVRFKKKNNPPKKEIKKIRRYDPRPGSF